MIYPFFLLGIYVLSFLFKLLILNMFRICLLGVYVLSFLLKLLILNMFRISLLGVYVLLFLLKLLILNILCISLWGIYFLWFSLLAPPFPFSLSYFFSHLFVFLFLSPSCFFSYLLVFLLLSVCISIVICLCFYYYLLVFLWYFAACTSAGIQRVLRPSYSSYHSRHTMCTTAVVHSPKAHTLCTISP